MHDNPEESHKHDAEQQKFNKKDYLLYDSIYKKFTNRQN